MTIQRFDRLEISISGQDATTEWITNVTFEINAQRTPVDTLKGVRAGYTDGAAYATLTGTAAINSDGSGCSILQHIISNSPVTVTIPIGSNDISFEGVFMSGGGSQAANANGEITFVIDGPIERDSFKV